MEKFDVIGIGVGPFNLSLAALAHPVGGLNSRFFEAKPHFQWHPGLMVPEAEIQVSFLKDLVTLVDPTSPFSYLNFLVAKGRIFQAMVANGMSSSRQEFEQYYQWVAGQLPSISWGQQVKSVSLNGDCFEVACESGEVARATTLALGSGRTPYLPDFAAVLRGPQVLHASDLLQIGPETAGRRVMVVGAGQSGAEVINYLLREGASLPESLTWVSSRAGFLPIDDSPFTNEWFAPAYVDHFRSLSPERRAQLLQQQRLSSDGISESLLWKIYRRLYQEETVGAGRLRHRLVANHRVLDMARDGEELTVRLHDGDQDREEQCAADLVIFCTGYHSDFPAYLEPLRERITTNGTGFEVREDYSLEWDGPKDLRIYVQNFAEGSHGIADPNLSLASWRSARILNSVVGRDQYLLGQPASLMSWSLA
ncbi:SidA/IucD/PvdA family monooxygenase [Streptomyces sp. NPDC005795]|uniref:lysine N(6)-hydroxylase/L-ornithine N(5)-oxygenase family protein n=1 Tax=Streptomyces sp. NPDC005795 TaxID=3154677 RepID=UPI0033EAE542